MPPHPNPLKPVRKAGFAWHVLLLATASWLLFVLVAVLIMRAASAAVEPRGTAGISYDFAGSVLCKSGPAVHDKFATGNDNLDYGELNTFG